MITKRLGIILAALVLGLGSVFALPSKTKTQQAGIVLELPRRIPPDWFGDELPVTDVERSALAPDTGFARRSYRNRFGDTVYLGIVLSGEDMANSIHRPERCLVAQGWSIQTPALRSVTVAGAPLEVTRILHTQAWPPVKPQFTRRDMTYYWFIGSRDRTASHFMRTFIDVRDRLFQGENQRWAYVTAEAPITEGMPERARNFGPVRTEAETAKIVEDFLANAVPTFTRPAEGAAGGLASNP